MRSSSPVFSVLLVVAIGVVAVATAARADVTVGSKNFEESRLLGEIFAQLIEADSDIVVDRRFNLAGTKVCFDGLRSGAIDVYPEYTGTGLMTILGASTHGGRDATRDHVRREFLDRWELWWLSPLGFENSYEIAVPREVARARGLVAISDLVPLAPSMTGAFGYEFSKRSDGLPGLARAYGLRFQSVKAMQQNLKYRAAALGQIDALDVYTTDGQLAVHDLVVLEDDRDFFPAYEAAPLVSGRALARHPELFAVLERLGGRIDAERMRRLNLRMQPPESVPVEAVARAALRELGLIETSDTGLVPTRDHTLLGYMAANRSVLLTRTAEHLALSGVALLLGVSVALPLALFLGRYRAVAEPTIRIIAITQTIPSIALLAFMLPLFGAVGWKPAVAALWIYSIFPILRGAYTGLREAPAEVVDAATSLGMTDTQVLRYVRLPLAAPVIMAGVRTAAVITVGTATLAAFIGAGGLGREIVAGLQLNDTVVVLSGAIPAALLAVLVDATLAVAEKGLSPSSESL